MTIRLKTWLSAGIALAAAGCATAPENREHPRYEGIFRCDSSDLSTLSASDDAAARKGPWTWEELAIRAGERSDATKVAYIDAAVRRLRAEEELRWKDPELRAGWGTSSSRKRGWDEDGDSISHGNENSWSAGVRFYVPNPFVERYARARSDADIRKEDARASLEAYEVYSEVKMLCYEEARTRVEVNYLRERTKAWDDLRKACDESFERGVFRSPLDAIRAETKYMKAKIKLDEVESQRATLRRRIAWLAGLPEAGLEIAEPSLELPDPAELSIERLVEVAFARRPDLAAAIAELEEAEAGVSAAKAARLPWFRFVEAAYASDSGNEREGFRSERDSSSEVSVKAALYLPIFTWAGESVRLSEMVRARANARLEALVASIREEIFTAFCDYRDASERVRAAESRAFVERMEKPIDEYAASDAAVAEETCKAREELIDYNNVQATAVMMRIEAALRLESVIGGPLESTRNAAPAQPDGESGE